MDRPEGTEAPHPLEFGMLLGAASRAWRAKLDQRLRDLGVGAAAFFTLGQLSRAGRELIQRELADRLGVEGPSLVRLLDRMEKDGWVCRKPSGSDRRQNLVVLTEKALPALERMREVARGLHREALATAPDEEVEAAVRLLRRVLPRLDEI